tara:strand:- start:158 stop:925 length:768 start_codon:yes stop_codon:yes gene_type:complete
MESDLSSVTGLSTDKIIRGAYMSAKRLGMPQNPACLDIGSGNGQLVLMLRKELNAETSACDYADGLMRVPGQKVDVVDIDREPLPYSDNTFDLITITEVIEHVRDFRKVFEEIFRCLKPGGGVVITTPNTINLSSRIRFLGFGFWTLFGPLHIKDSRKYSTGGHISPINWFYLVHGLLDAGFEYGATTVDKKQKSSAALLAVLAIPIWVYSKIATRREIRRYGTVDDKNLWMVKHMSSLDLLLGRTVIVSAKKPA